MEFEDSKGKHKACADIVIPEEALIIECKRTYTEEADAQLWLLYLPLVSRIWPASYRLVVACQYWQGPEKLPLVACPLQASVGISYCLWR